MFAFVRNLLARLFGPGDEAKPSQPRIETEPVASPSKTPKAAGREKKQKRPAEADVAEKRGEEPVLERPSAHQIATGPEFASFELHPSILKGLNEAGFLRCTPVQEKTLPLSLSGKDVAAQAQTGTGKTAAFLITVFQRMMKDDGEKLQGCSALILAPTRELAVQIHNDAELIGKHLPVRSTVIYGGVGYDPQTKALESGTEMIIATPGRLIDLMKQRYFKPKNVQALVIDEADRMFDMGFIQDLRYIMRRLQPYYKRQSMLFSATLSARVMELTYEFMNQPEEIIIDPEKLLVDEVNHVLYHVASEEKIPLLLGLFKTEAMERVLIFANTKAQVMRLEDRLNANDIRARAITGDFAQNKREKILDQFKKGKVSVLVATDVASRGLHVEDISHVINYDVPQDREEYVHRIGRTARAGKAGRAITLASERDAHSLEPIEEMLGQKIPVAWVEDDMLVPDTAPHRRPPADRSRRSRPPRSKGKRGDTGSGARAASQPASKTPPKSDSKSGSRRRRSRRRRKSPGEKKN